MSLDKTLNPQGLKYFLTKISTMFRKQTDKIGFDDLTTDLQTRITYPKGFMIYSKEEIDPAILFGGTWEYDADSHDFEGLYKYTRIEEE